MSIEMLVTQTPWVTVPFLARMECRRCGYRYLGFFSSGWSYEYPIETAECSDCGWMACAMIGSATFMN